MVQQPKNHSHILFLFPDMLRRHPPALHPRAQLSAAGWHSRVATASLTLSSPSARELKRRHGIPATGAPRARCRHRLLSNHVPSRAAPCWPPLWADMRAHYLVGTLCRCASEDEHWSAVAAGYRSLVVMKH
jgi:hypothetical protein